MAQDEAVAVGVGDGDAPLLPVGVASCDSGAPGLGQAIEEVGLGGSAEVEHQQVLLSGCWWGGALQVGEQLEVPAGAGPADHHQVALVTAVGWSTPEHVQAQTVDPELLGGRQVAARASYAQMTVQSGRHQHIIAWSPTTDPAPLADPLSACFRTVSAVGGDCDRCRGWWVASGPAQ